MYATWLRGTKKSPQVFPIAEIYSSETPMLKGQKRHNIAGQEPGWLELEKQGRH